MRILIAHNRYQLRGGEDTVVAAETKMLAQHGHDVEYMGFDNESARGFKGKCVAAANVFYSFSAASLVSERIASFRPDVIHVHNFLAAISPSIFFEAHAAKIPVVLTLHNYRLLCCNALFLRNGKPCECCLQRRSFLPGAVNACYRDSHIGSAILGGSIALHSALGTWRRRVDRYIVLTSYAAKKMSSYRVPFERIRIKPNFTTGSRVGTGGGGFALFAGRLSPEKGVQTLIDADANGLLSMPIHVVGDGPMREVLLLASMQKNSRLHILGPKSHMELQQLMRKATVLVVPSVWYEGLPMVCIEAYAAGLPVLCSNMGSLSEIVIDGITGRLFPSGDPIEFSRALMLFVEGSDELRRMRSAARQRFEKLYSEESNYEQLLGIYQELVPCI